MRAFGVGAIRVMIGDFIRVVRTWRWVAAPSTVVDLTTLDAIVEPPDAELEQEITDTASSRPPTPTAPPST